MFRAGGIYCACWLVLLVVPLLAHYAPGGVAVPLFRASMDCLFPYDRTVFAEGVVTTLNVLHVSIAAAVFSLVAHRLSLCLAVVLALVAVPLLGILARAAMYPFRVIV